jgi:hypothetical protein
MRASTDELRATAIALFLTALSFGIAGCEKEGPLEEAGEAIDERVEDAREGLEDAAEEVEEAAEEAEEALRDR